MSGHHFAPSMPAGSHEMRDHYSNQDPPRSVPHTAPSDTPYLGLRARLSQVWMNRWTILLLLVLVRTLFAIQSIDHNLASARREALSACSEVESLGSNMASMPHYMSAGINSLTAAGVEKSVNGLMSLSTLSVTAVEEIVIFVIGMMTNTYLCLITLAVNGSLQAAIKVVDEAQKGFDTVSDEAGDSIANSLDTLKNGLNEVADTVENGFNTIFGGGSELPEIPDLTEQLNKIRDFKLPDLTQDLKKLNDSMPTFEEVKKATEDVIRIPFREVKELINENLGTYTFNRSLFPVPAKEQLTFCADNNGLNDFFDGLVKTAVTFKKVFTAVLVTAAVLSIIPMAWREIRRWRHQQERSRMVNNGATDPMDVVYLVSRPYTSSAGLWFARVPAEPEAIKSASRRQNLIRWTVAYATTDSALFVLCLGLAGLFACLCQFILLRQIAKQTPGLADQVGAFAEKVVTQLNNASEQWSIGTNAAIKSASDDINNDMFGWVEKATGAVNDTLNTFVDETSNVLDKAFGNTPLRDPIQEVLNCLILLKVQGIQKALTWVEENAHINFSPLPNDTFSLASLSDGTDDDGSASFLSDPSGQSADKISATINRVVEFMEDTIRQEALISTVVVLLWVLTCLIGTGWALYRSYYGHEKTRGEGGAVLQHDSHSSTSTLDFRSDDHGRHATQIPMSQLDNSNAYEPAPEYSESVKPRTRNDTSVSYASYDEPKLGIATTTSERHEKSREIF